VSAGEKARRPDGKEGGQRAAAFPPAFAIGEVNAGEEAAVEAESVAVVADEIIEVGFEADRGPSLFGGPSGGLVHDGDTADAQARSQYPTLTDAQAVAKTE
jgi:hypothetical protein